MKIVHCVFCNELIAKCKYYFVRSVLQLFQVFFLTLFHLSTRTGGHRYLKTTICKALNTQQFIKHNSFHCAKCHHLIARLTKSHCIIHSEPQPIIDSNSNHMQKKQCEIAKSVIGFHLRCTLYIIV